MAAVAYAPRALGDLERLVDFLLETEEASAAATFELIESAVSVLVMHPLIGRPVEAGLRELVISRGRTGYLAPYRYDEARDQVLVLAIRHQREAGYQ
jgi:plasmid stabilization system protein ParE